MDSSEIRYYLNSVRTSIFWTKWEHPDFELSENIQILNFVRTSGFWMFSQSWVFGLFGLESGLEGQLWPWIWNLWPFFPCRPILSYLYSCFGHFWQLREKNLKTHNYYTCVAAGKNNILQKHTYKCCAKRGDFRVVEVRYLRNCNRSRVLCH